MSQEFRLKNIDERRNYFLEEIKQNELMSKKHKKVCTTLNYIEHFLVLASAITGCISISAFASLIGIPIGVRSSAIGLKLCAITALSSIEVLIPKALINSVISHDEIVLINNVLKEFNKMEKEIKHLNT